jgi:hypothetical protein
MMDYRLTKIGFKKLNKSDKNTAIRIKSVLFLLIKKDITGEFYKVILVFSKYVLENLHLYIRLTMC